MRADNINLRLGGELPRVCRMVVILASAYLVGLGLCIAVGSESGPLEEARLIQALDASNSAAEKAQACSRLKQVGSVASVPALVRCVADEALFQEALDALETLPGWEVDDALLKVLPAVKGKIRLGVIHVLGERRDPRSVAAIAAFLEAGSLAQDPEAGNHAANALGRIGGNEAIQVLNGLLPNAPAGTRNALVNALLQCANAAADKGEQSTAMSIFRQFDTAKEAGHVRAAAYGGLIRAAAGAEALALIESGLVQDDAARVSAALAAARELLRRERTNVTGPTVVSLSGILQKVSEERVIAIIGLLEQSGDARALAAVTTATTNRVPEVRLAALKAIGSLPWKQGEEGFDGDETILLLAGAAAQGTSAEKGAARQSLTRISGKGVAERMVSLLQKVDSATQAELIQALAARRERQVVALLLGIAQQREGEARKAAVRGLAALAEVEDLPGLLGLLAMQREPGMRGEVRQVFVSVAERANGVLSDPSALIRMIGTGTLDSRMLALEVGGLFIHADIRAALTLAAKDGDSQIAAAAQGAVAASRDPGLLRQKLDLARMTKEPRLRRMAFENYVRAAADGASVLTLAQRLEVLINAYAFCEQTDGDAAEMWRLVLSVAGGVPHPEALKLALKARAKQKFRPEAEIACVKIAEALLTTHAERATQSLELIATEGSTPAIRISATTVMEKFFSGWLYAGPFRVAEKNYSDLFGIEFPPERGDTNVAWRPVPGDETFVQSATVDLAGVTEGEQCVVYLKTCVFIAEAAPVRLQIGSDDGLKLWVNGQLVHANNAARPLVAAQDSAEAELTAGWNTFLAKLTQNVGGCGFSLRIVNRDGAPLRDMKWSTRCR